MYILGFFILANPKIIRPYAPEELVRVRWATLEMAVASVLYSSTPLFCVSSLLFVLFVGNEGGETIIDGIAGVGTAVL